MKKYGLLVLCVLALNAHGKDYYPIVGIAAQNGSISWPDTRGWMQVQDTSDNLRTPAGCEGFITSCYVGSSGVYQVLDLSSGRKSTNIRPAPPSQASQQGCISNYRLPVDGAWYKLLEKETFASVCQTSSSDKSLLSPCTVKPGAYRLVKILNKKLSVTEQQVSCQAPSQSWPTSRALPKLESNLHRVFGGANLNLSVNGTTATARVALPSSAPLQIYWRREGENTWKERVPSNDSGRYRLHIQPFAAVSGSKIQVYAADHIFGSYQTEIKSITVPGSGGVQRMNSSNLKANGADDVVFASSFNDRGYTTPPSGPGEVMRTVVRPNANRGSSRERILTGADVLDAEFEFEMLVLAEGPTSGNFKMPGLAGETSVNGGGQGGSNTTGYNAWSARGQMHYRKSESSSRWLTMGSEVSHQDDGAEGAVKGYGQTIWNTADGSISGARPAKVTPGKWDRWRQRVRVNDVGRYNGIIQWYKNDVLVYERKNFRFAQTDAHRRIHKAWAIVYHGGNVNTANTTTKFFFADMKVNILETRPD